VLVPFQGGLRGCLASLLLRFQRGNLGKLSFDLPAPLLVPLLPLNEPQVFQLTLVMPLLERRSCYTQLGESFVVLGQ